MSAGTQPATPKDITDYEPLKLMPDHIALLSNKLDEWLTEITRDKKLPKKVILTDESAKEVRLAIEQFLEKTKTYISLKEALLIRHP